jgi:hypothetical protein
MGSTGFSRRYFHLDKLVDRLRKLSLIGSELIDRTPHLPEIFFEDRLARMLDTALIGWEGNR